MLYLIGGPPRSGKTTVAQLLAKQKSIPYFSLDHVTSVVSPYIPRKEFKIKLPLRIALQITKFSNDVFYGQYSSKQIIDFYLVQAETYWAGVESFIKYALQDDHDLILEGWQLLPHRLASLVTSENRHKMKILFLYKTNVTHINDGLQASTAKNDWVMKNTKKSTTFAKIAKELSQFGSHFHKEAEKYHFKSINMDVDFKQKIKVALKQLSS